MTYYTDEEVISTTFPYLVGNDVPNAPVKTAPPSETTQQLNDLNITIRLLGEQLQNQQRRVEELM